MGFTGSALSTEEYTLYTKKYQFVPACVCVRACLTAGAAAEAAVVVEVSHGLAGLVGSVDGLVTLHTHPWNTTHTHAHAHTHTHTHRFSHKEQPSPQPLANTA